MGPADTCYQGAMLHLEINFPQTYPKDPPVINVLTPFEHPNIFGNILCLDMLQKKEFGEDNIGWSSAYTVESILIQLQSFLFEGSWRFQTSTFQNSDKAMKI